jgi:hypothetical protein
LAWTSIGGRAVLGEQRLRAVEVGQDGAEQAGALGEAGLQLRPFSARSPPAAGRSSARRAAIVQQVDRRARSSSCRRALSTRSLKPPGSARMTLKCLASDSGIDFWPVTSSS